jgi:hypothetical protein
MHFDTQHGFLSLMSTLQKQDMGRRPVRRIPPLDRHRRKRIAELGATVTAHSIRASVDREHTAQVAVVTTEQELEDSRDVRHGASAAILNST